MNLGFIFLVVISLFVVSISNLPLSVNSFEGTGLVIGMSCKANADCRNVNEVCYSNMCINRAWITKLDKMSAEKKQKILEQFKAKYEKSQTQPASNSQPTPVQEQSVEKEKESGKISSLCGNGIVEQDEVCDDGNDDDTDQCRFNCSLFIKSTVSPYVMCTKDVILKVFDANKIPLNKAIVSIYNYENTMSATSGSQPIHFPWDQYPETLLMVKGKTSESGEFKIENEWLTNTKMYAFVVEKKGFLPSFVDEKQCFTNYKYDFFLQTPPSQFLTIDQKQNVLPVTVMITNTHISNLEVSGREIMFPYIPSVREDLSNNLQSVDITLNIFQVKTTLYPNQKETMFLQKKSSNVKLNQLNVFMYTLPEGIYYSFFSFKLNYKDGSKKEFNYYPNHATWGTIIEKPSFVDQKLLTQSIEYISSVRVYPQQNEEKFVSLMGENTGGNTKLNIVFLNVGFDKELFKSIVNHLIYSNKGFTNVEPYMSNKDKLNFWYYPDILSYDEASWPVSENTKIIAQLVPLTKTQKIYLSHDIKGKTFFIALVNDDQIISDTIAGAGKCKFEKGTQVAINKNMLLQCLSGKDMSQCFDQFDLARVFNHEMGHEIGILGEEYVDNNKLFDINSFVSNQKYLYNNYKSNTFFIEGLDPTEYCFTSLFTGGKIPYNYIGNEVICSSQFKVLNCTQSQWGDLIGNGCGSDGLVDCGKDDPNYYWEVGCYSGGGMSGGKNTGSNLLKPTRFSIMHLGGKFNYALEKSPTSRVYGVANERSICRAIKTYTGSAGGVCNELCIDGCKQGERCIQGTCQAVKT